MSIASERCRRIGKRPFKRRVICWKALMLSCASRACNGAQRSGRSSTKCARMRSSRRACAITSPTMRPGDDRIDDERANT